MALLRDYDWPGNVRELQNVVERLVNIIDGDVVTLEHLPESIAFFNGEKTAELVQLPPSFNTEGLSERENIRNLKDVKERKRIIDLLDHFGGNISKVAREMRMSRSTLYRRMLQYNISN
jgi:DNA-binding NtrC family response regulator